jgi:hypothetical protein
MGFYIEGPLDDSYMGVIQFHKYIKFDDQNIFHISHLGFSQQSIGYMEQRWGSFLNTSLTILVADCINVQNPSKPLNHDMTERDPFDVRVGWNNAKWKAKNLKEANISPTSYSTSKNPNMSLTDKDWWMRILFFSKQFTRNDIFDLKKAPTFVGEALDRLSY